MDSRITSLPSQLHVPLTLPDVVIDPVMLTDAHVKNTVKNDTMVADSKMTKDRGVPRLSTRYHRKYSCATVTRDVLWCTQSSVNAPRSFAHLPTIQIERNNDVDHGARRN